MKTIGEAIDRAQELITIVTGLGFTRTMRLSFHVDYMWDENDPSRYQKRHLTASVDTEGHMHVQYSINGHPHGILYVRSAYPTGFNHTRYTEGPDTIPDGEICGAIEALTLQVLTELTRLSSKPMRKALKDAKAVIAYLALTDKDARTQEAEEVTERTEAGPADRGLTAVVSDPSVVQ